MNRWCKKLSGLHRHGVKKAIKYLVSKEFLESEVAVNPRSRLSKGSEVHSNPANMQLKGYRRFVSATTESGAERRYAKYGYCWGRSGSC